MPKEPQPYATSVKHAFVGVDAEGTPCIYIGLLDESGTFDPSRGQGRYLDMTELTRVADKLNQRKGWSDEL